MVSLPFILEIAALYSTALLSASIIPFPSDPVIAGAAALFSPFLVFLVSTAGGISGSAVNYFIGLKGLHRFVEKDKKFEKKAEEKFEKWGPAILVVAPWIPFFGDPLTIVAGSLKMPFKRFFITVTVGRAIKTAALVLLGEALMGVFLI